MAAAPDGTFYLCFLGIQWFKGLPYPLTHAGNFVSKSTDKGRTWSEPVLVHTPLDHPRIVVDPTTGRVYQSSGDRATAYPSPATEADPETPYSADWDRFTVASDDGITWTTPKGWGGGVEHDNYSQVYVSAANGVLAGVFQHVDATGLGLGIDVLLYDTKDGGETWTERVVASGPEIKRKLWVSFSREGVLAVLWVADEPGPGKSWTVPAIGPPFDDEEPSTEVTYPYHVCVAISQDGGTTFGETITATAEPSPPGDAHRAIGHSCACVVMTHDTAYVAWGDWSPVGSLGTPGDDSAGFFRSIRFR